MPILSAVTNTRSSNTYNYSKTCALNDVYFHIQTKTEGQKADVIIWRGVPWCGVGVGLMGTKLCVQQSPK